ncbi:MAG: hypothetical protein AVDCRST_MAG69-478 [uncultured Solirubrobacteraceae bacterium]|uniref:Type IV pilus biogenesis protein PilO n=1 Tax=uncultured Solirubrobacteraceae bacterium TaxID=1162706 RepID=A0A6J4RQC9_9ACTN|nr:MAG: hypothetical protein AVDCRST_MAG69-478 [uncultured Solirubrobacteraceae bacterium]
MSLRRNHRLLLALVVLAAAVGAFWMLVLSPKREEASALSEQIAAKQVELDAARQQVVTYEQAREAYPANYATVARLGKAVPADDDVRSLVVQLDAAAKRSNVDFELIDVGKGAATPDAAAKNVIPGASLNAAGFTTLPMSFAFHGSYFELSSFFTRLERFVTVSNRRIDVTGRLLLLQSISLVPGGDGFPQMRAQINATSYLVPPAEGLTDGASPQGPGAAPVPAAGAAPGAKPVVTTATVTGGVR